jgi:hypothetical protein
MRCRRHLMRADLRSGYDVWVWRSLAICVSSPLFSPDGERPTRSAGEGTVVGLEEAKISGEH